MKAGGLVNAQELVVTEVITNDMEIVDVVSRSK